ncbi:MAG: Do family serine endopeptidase [Chitinophagales bacterium]|nr:Do family serine endopeptidase [Chitinophagales bacterium]
MKKFLNYLFVGVISGGIVLFAQTKFSKNHSFNLFNTDNVSNTSDYSVPAAFTSLGNGLPSDAFVLASERSMPAVVHITTKAKTTVSDRRAPSDLFEYFFGDPFGNPFGDRGNRDDGSRRGKSQEETVPLGSGSGVIISSDGYIVTNNHVIDGATEIEVVLHDNRSFPAKLIGTDPNTDIALIKIDNNDLTPIQFGNSDGTKVGQWVLAVGNPFNLSSTVTAGIISAKARNINLLQEKAGTYAIESFIQTDAAVNPGNSGGALVDLNGDLIGINTAIASPSGVYAGYAFAIPSNLVKKVVDDIKEFGIVQRGFMGVSMGTVDDKLAKDLGLDDVSGAYVSDVQKGSGADDAGLKGGDVITKIDGKIIKTSPELQEAVARHRPGDKINVEYIRSGKIKSTVVTLKSKNNTTDLLSKKDADATTGSALDRLGIEVESLSTGDARKMGMTGGLKIKKLKDGILKNNTDIKEGFIITGVNKRPVESVDDLEDILKNSRGEGVMLQGKYPNENGTRYYAFGF